MNFGPVAPEMICTKAHALDRAIERLPQLAGATRNEAAAALRPLAATALRDGRLMEMRGRTFSVQHAGLGFVFQAEPSESGQWVLITVMVGAKPSKASGRGSPERQRVPGGAQRVKERKCAKFARRCGGKQRYNGVDEGEG